MLRALGSPGTLEKKPHISVINKLHSLHLSLGQIRMRQPNNGTLHECLRLIPGISLQ